MTDTLTDAVSLETRSSEIDKLATALAKAQAAMEGARKDKNNPHFKAAYADIASVWDAIREPLASNGLSIVQLPTTVQGGVEVETLMFHESGQYIRNVLRMPCGQQMTPHTIGSAITYGRRYSLMAVAGVAPEDDDGNRANGKSEPEPYQPGPVGSAAAGTDFRPAGPRRMPPKDFVEAARQDGTLDEGRPKGVTPAKHAARQAVDRVALAQWVKDSIHAFGEIHTKDALVQWWRDNPENRANVDELMPAEAERLLVAYDARMETLKAKGA